MTRRRRSKAASRRARPTLRVLLGAVIAIGPGKADLLEAIAATGSISAAAKRMGMSYRRAWMLVDTMNRCFSAPLVAAATGGRRGGGAQVTPEGLDVLRRYRAMETRAMVAIRPDLSRFIGLLRPRPGR
ncbi:MAG TPA: LysR family transcriptional regulator [Gammaproteobacteria bacterium]|nr:LysR family transcriptional regulator [Gammaproteobacteria bacterium]